MAIGAGRRALIVLGYGTSWLILKALGGVPDRMPPKDAMVDMAAGSGPSAKVGSAFDAWSLLGAEPHSGSTMP